MASTTEKPLSEKATLSPSTPSPKPTTTTPTSKTAPKKKRGGLFSCCFSSSAFEDDTPAPRPVSTSMSTKDHAAPATTAATTGATAGAAAIAGTGIATAAAASSAAKDNDSSAPATATTLAPPIALPTPSALKAADITPDPAAASTSEPEASTSAAPTTSTDEAPTTDDLLAAEAAQANSSPDGAPLPLSDTEGVTSAGVMPPGVRNSPHKNADGSTRRRIGKKAKARAKARKEEEKRKAAENVITSVPEPGSPKAGLGGGFPGIAVADSEDEDDEDDEETDESDDSEDEEEVEDEEQRLIAQGGVGIPIGPDGKPKPLLDELSGIMVGRKCLVLDLDETLVHSSFKQMVHQADYVVPVEIESQFHNVYVIKRPGVDAFLKAMGEIYEVVIFTASLSKYADPVLDHLDVSRVVQGRLFRESCYNNKGSYVKDLSQLGRPMADSIIIDNSPASYVFHPNNAVPISSWFNDPHDTELTDLIPFLTDLAKVDDVRSVLDAGLYQQIA